ncbi:peptidase inhibitor family I36 protein [Actinoplanes sp. TRM 88003]|uniref:Peptidase inhibitor family I36 protein n=1 Tax=Paractinoplanes aksuensis TaxID=2939490 RepID=A0ABT1E2K4_9ACTN|nr:peptidase inhibitor family I36 protein [Actinoplanes aksuensis]MCO8277328.1 peptidase inhibitor family I36 protein [Actinoplanes aksuensis]
MIRKIGTALAIAAGAIAAVGVAAPASAANGDKVIDTGEVVVWKDANLTGQFYDFGTTVPAYPSVTAVNFDNCPNLNNDKWFVNPDETARKPTATANGLEFNSTDLIHRNVAGTLSTDDLDPGTYTASPTPDQPSFFSVEVFGGTSDSYGTLRWDPATGLWSMTVPPSRPNPGYYDDVDPSVVVTQAGKSKNVVRFGVGYTNNPAGTVTTVVSDVTFQGVTYKLDCKNLPAFGTPPATTTAIDNNGSSIVNYSNSYVRAYANANYTGTYIQLLPYGQAIGTLSYAYSTLGTLDNALSSHRVAGP